MIHKRIYCFTLIVFCLPCCMTSAAESKPNILFILADDVGQECLQCYGGESYRTPHLDKLAKTGQRFRHCYSMPTCHPSRLTLFTGKYPFRHGQVTWGDFPKSEEQHTFANMLINAGYQTAAAGKWQMTLLRDNPQHPQRLGFQTSDLFGWHEGPRFYEPMIYHNGKVRQDTLGFYGPDLYVSSLIQFMKQNRNRPFFAFFPMALCHEVTDDLETPVPHGPFDRYDSFAEMVEEMDRSIGRLVSALNALQLREKTLILFVGDNGTPQTLITRAEGKQLIKEPVVSRQNGRDIPGGKSTLFDGGTRVPLIANWPGTVKPEQVVDDLVDFSDFLPTFAQLAGVKISKERNLDGVSFAPRLYGHAKSPRTWAYAEESVLPLPGGVKPSGKSSGRFWVRTARWKLYNDSKLYDLENDPQEKKPLPAKTDDQERKAARHLLESAILNLKPKK